MGSFSKENGSMVFIPGTDWLSCHSFPFCLHKMTTYAKSLRKIILSFNVSVNPTMFDTNRRVKKINYYSFHFVAWISVDFDDVPFFILLWSLQFLPKIVGMSIQTPPFSYMNEENKADGKTERSCNTTLIQHFMANIIYLVVDNFRVNSVTAKELSVILIGFRSLFYFTMQ